jgi:hypothetical protein
MAINYRSFTSASATDGTLEISKPSGVVAGDLLILHILTDADPLALIPEGFILVPGSTITGSFPIRLYFKYATANEPTTYQVLFNVGSVYAAMSALYADSGNPLEVDAIQSQTNGTSNTSISFPSVTTTVNDTLLMAFAISSSTGTVTPDALMTEQYDVALTGRPFLMTEARPTAGATGTRLATRSNNGTSKVVTLALREATGNTGDITVTQYGLYVEENPDPQIQVTQFGTYIEENPDPRIVTTQYGLYIEIEPGGPPSNEQYVTELPVFAELEGEGEEVTELPVFAEFAAVGVNITQLPTYAEFAAEGLNVTSLPVFIEFEYHSTGGMIIIGEYKTWKDWYPKNVTDIPLFQAYNFMISTNGMYMIDLEWDDVEDEDGYEIERSPNGVSDWELVHTTDPDVTKYVSILLEPDTTYYYRIRSFNEGGYSPYSDVISETTRKIGPSLIGKSGMANIQNKYIIIEKPPNVQTGDFMLMQIGIQDPGNIIAPSGWTLETTIPGVYSNLIYSKVATPIEPDYYTIQRSGSETPIVTLAIFAWDGTSDQIIFFDG